MGTIDVLTYVQKTTVTPLTINCNDTDPYIVDRAIRFWERGELAVGKEKIVEHAIIRPPNGADINVTDTMSTITALMKLHVVALAFRDERMQQAVLAELRFYLMEEIRDFKEFFDALRDAYLGDHPYASAVAVKKILLTAFVLRGADVHDSRRHDYFHGLLRGCQDLERDFRKGQVYRVGMQGKEIEALREDIEALRKEIEAADKKLEALRKKKEVGTGQSDEDDDGDENEEEADGGEKPEKKKRKMG